MGNIHPHMGLLLHDSLYEETTKKGFILSLYVNVILKVKLFAIDKSKQRYIWKLDTHKEMVNY